jgi:hypothetical protein
MNEEELKKGCGLGFWYRDIQFVYCGDKLFLCPTCQARLEGFQKGKLEQKKEELEFLLDLNLHYTNYIENNVVSERIKELDKEIEQLQKEIGGME